VFNSSGKLLRTQTAFFISGDGRFITTAHAIDDGVNAVAKMASGEIHNVGGILASSATLDLAILQADVKRVPFLRLNKTANLEPGTHVGVVGSALAGTAEAARETTISTQQPDDVEIVATLSSGRFRLNFNARGNVTNVQVIQSTGNNVIDQSALSTLRQWRSAPGQDWAATVPVTFQSR
jgi:TonB family protein